MTRKQQKMLNAVCGDLEQINWHGHRLDKDDWRHTLAGTVLGFRFVPGINTGQGQPGLVMLGRSSLDLSKTQAAEAINLGLDIGDRPEDQGLRCKPVRWSDVVLLGQGFNPRDFREAA
ncbi:recombination protein NinB [Pseudoxanthomonas sp. JBR18]|uniref:recombination protein NinB n=1 Tax=Pseudoxanthomonas sp. JBR18 TaxID=2969308 RepID=UPI002305D526|nr:recombination protein NinB [Pseudoxanthomonas sp. JBR18]WCE04450.1 recombination protein NinB [Pseudoxanthomonas sp. JBR18]